MHYFYDIVIEVCFILTVRTVEYNNIDCNISWLPFKLTSRPRNNIITFHSLRPRQLSRP